MRDTTVAQWFYVSNDIKNARPSITSTCKTNTNLAPESELEEEVQDAVRYSAAEGMLQIDLVSLEHLIGELGAPPHHHPYQMVLQHGNHRVRNITLLRAQTRVQILVELLRQFLQDNSAVSDLFTIEFDEGQLAFLGTEFHLVVHILQEQKILSMSCKWYYEYKIKC